MGIRERRQVPGNENFKNAAVLARAMYVAYKQTTLEYNDQAIQCLAKQLLESLRQVIVDHKDSRRRNMASNRQR